nr:hypothetical protein CFP56_57648 [Quercus suber]
MSWRDMVCPDSFRPESHRFCNSSHPQLSSLIVHSVTTLPRPPQRSNRPGRTAADISQLHIEQDAGLYRYQHPHLAWPDMSMSYCSPIMASMFAGQQRRLCPG